MVQLRGRVLGHTLGFWMGGDAVTPSREQKDAARRLRNAMLNRRRIRYVVRLQWRNPDGLRPGGDPRNWKDWRVFAVIPILFYTQDDAWDYTRMVDIFKNTGRKPSCTVETVVLP
jgi:hypothetical protein